MRNEIETLELVAIQKTVKFITKKYFKNTSKQKDVMQDCLAKILVNINKYDSSKAKLSTWASRVANNYCIDVLRKEQREQKYILNIDAGMLNIADTITDSFSNEAINIAYKYVNKILSEYKILHVDVLLFCKKDSNTYKEAAIKFNMSVENIRTIISRLTKSLRKQIEQRGDTEYMVNLLA